MGSWRTSAPRRCPAGPSAAMSPRSDAHSHELNGRGVFILRRARSVVSTLLLSSPRAAGADAAPVVSSPVCGPHQEVDPFEVQTHEPTLFLSGERAQNHRPRPRLCLFCAATASPPDCRSRGGLATARRPDSRTSRGQPPAPGRALPRCHEPRPPIRVRTTPWGSAVVFSRGGVSRARCVACSPRELTDLIS